MVKSVYVPEAGGIIDFADDITPQEMSSYINRKYPRVTAPAATPEPSYDNSGVLGRFAYGFGTGISDVPGGIASLLYPAEEAKKTSAGQFSEEARKYLQETFGIDPTKDPTTAQWLAETLGSAASFLVPGGAAAKGASLVGKGAALAGRAGAVTAGAQGVALGAGSRAKTIEQQLASGMEISPEQQLASQRLSGLIGASEALPMQKFFGPLTTLLSKVPASKSGVVEQIIQSRLAKVTKAGAQEAAQEVASGIANDLMEYGVYNPDVELGQDILSNAGGGAFAGSVIEGVIQLAAGRKLRGARQLQADIEKEKQANSADLQRANVAVAADELTKSGVEGTLSVEANEAPDGSIRHTVMSPDNKPLVDLPTADDAVQAINLYKQKTGKEVAASVKEAPALNPVRVGNKSFPTVEAAISEHERLKKEVTNLEWRLNNPKEIEDIAKQRNIPAQALFKQHVDTLEDRRKALSMFDTYFSPEPVTPVEPQAKVEIATPEAVASVAAPVAAPEPIAEPVAPAESKPEEYDKSFSKPEPEETLTPITSEEEVPEMPIGAVELPIEESRILPDTIVEDEFIPEPGIEPAPVRIEKRPDATVDDLASLQTELFGQPINIREMTPEQKAIYEAERDKRFPPKETDVYYAGGPLREPSPKNLREANITGPAVKDYSPETQAWIKGVYTQLQSRLQSIIPDKANIELKTLVDAPAGYLVRGQVRAEKAPDGMKSIIDLSTGILEPGMPVEDAVKKLSEILNHEVIHVLRNKGVIRPAEWRILTRAVQNTKVPGKKYTYLDKAEAVYTPNGQPISEAYADPDAVIEEAVAEMYREWVINRNKPKEQNAVGILNRIAEFFRRIFQTLRNARHEEFFKKIEAGEVGRREGEMSGRAAMFSAAPLPVAVPGQPLSNDLNDRNGKAFGLYPYLRTASPQYYDHKRLILGATNPGNAAAQIADLDALLARHPNTLKSKEAFARYLADAQGRMATPETGVPIVPYKAVEFANDPSLVARQIGRLTPGQLAMADSGLSAALDLKKAYMSGTATPVHTAKLILWGILSRGVSPFVQESMFLDVVAPRGLSNRTGRMAGGIDPFIIDAVEGNFDLDAYMDYVKTLKIDGLPGAGTTHNLGAFGKTTLVKLQQRVPDGRTLLQYLHDLISDYSLSGKEVRRKFHEVNTGIGINNKVLSFALLVSGRDDVLVLDRVQMRNQFNNGNFNDYNLYDGVKIERPVLDKNGNPVLDKKGNPKIDSVAETGTGIAPIGDGVFGLMYYEALERDLAKSVRQAYNMLGRGNQFSMGRYHWESWVASSAQEVDHGSVSGLIKDALGENDPYAGIYTGEGKYDTYNSGIKYGYTKNGEAYVALPDGLGAHYYFTPEYAKKVVAGYDKRSTGIISDPTFKVSESTQGAWYDRPEVNKQNLRRYLLRHRDAFAEQRRLGAQQAVRGAGKGDTTGTGPGPVHAVGRRGGVRQPQVGDNKKVAQSIADKYISRTGLPVKFSAAPLPQYVQKQNETLFTAAPKVSFRDMLFNYVFGSGGTEKTVTVNGVTVPVSKKAVAGKVAAVDNAAYVAELEKIANQQATGNYQRQQADYSATAALSWLRRSSHIMASMMLRGNLSLNYDRPGDILSATMKVTDDPDNLKEVFKVMTEPGPDGPNGEKTTKADIFKTYAVAKRGEWLRATGQTVPRELTPQYIAQTIPFVEREYPEVVEAYKKYQRFNKKLMTTARDAGLISTAELGRLTNQMNYYGFIYEVYGEPLGPSTGQKAASRFKLRPYTGTQRGGLVNDPMFVMIQNAQFLVTSVAKNLAVTKSFELAKTMGEARLLQTDEKPDESRDEQPDVMFYSKDGVVQRFAVKDPLMVTALGSDDRINVGRFWEILGLPTHVLRESVTRDPGFMARNLLRDTLSAWITSGADFTPVIGTLKNFTLAIKSGGSFEALAARGVVGSYDLAMQTPEELSATFRRNLMPKNVHTFASVEGAAALGRSLWNRLGTISEASDAATRMAVYDACIAQGMSEAEAAMQAIELLDFTRRGASQTLGILTKLIPFLNARIQGLDVLYQAGRAGIRYATGRSLGEKDANIGKKFLIRGGMLAAISMLLEHMNQDDEDYKQLDSYIKEGNLLIPLREFGLPGQFIAFPKPFEAGLLFSTLPQQIVKGINGDASLRENADLFWGSIGSTFGVNPIPQALLPPIEIITNHNFFTGLPLISEGKARLAPELQYNTSTSQLAMMIGGLPIFYDFTTGKFGGASPVVIDKIISGYGGPIGSYLSQAVSLGMQDAEIGPERMPVELSNAPVVRSFFIDAKSKNPKVVTQAYELFRIADEANRTVSRLKQMQDAEALTEYIDKNRDVLMYKKYIFTLADRLNKLSAQERAIERDTTMTAEEKIAAQRELRDVRIRLASKVEEINRQLGR